MTTKRTTKRKPTKATKRKATKATKRKTTKATKTTSTRRKRTRPADVITRAHKALLRLAGEVGSDERAPLASLSRVVEMLTEDARARKS